MARLLVNPNQTSDCQIYHTKDGEMINVHKSGIYFSDDKSMDSVVKYFIDELGFKEVKQTKKKK
jgi:hypothetical protein